VSLPSLVRLERIYSRLLIDARGEGVVPFIDATALIKIIVVLTKLNILDN
jgi:hypothetical protein